MDKSKDGLEMRCPRLGGTVSFQYCRISGDDRLPCRKLADCWWESFDVTSYLRENLTDSQFQGFVQTAQQPQPKVSSLVELIEQARSRL